MQTATIDPTVPLIGPGVMCGLGLYVLCRVLGLHGWGLAGFAAVSIVFLPALPWLAVTFWGIVRLVDWTGTLGGHGTGGAPSISRPAASAGRAVPDRARPRAIPDVAGASCRP